MPVPKRQHSKSRRDKRAAGKHKIPLIAGVCGTCKSSSIQHSVCIGCGFYKGMKVLRTKSERAQERKIALTVREQSLAEVAAKRKIMAEQHAKEAIANEVSSDSDKKS